MTLLAEILTAVLQLPLAITPAQRWGSARQQGYGSGDTRVLYILVLGLLAAVAVAIVVLLVRRAIMQRRRTVREFHDHCERAGLGEEEINLLMYAAKLGQLRSIVNIAVTEAVFHRCMYLLVGCERVMNMPTADKSKILSVINSAQLKLDFEGSSSLVASRQIPEGAIIMLSGPGIVEPVQATIVSAQGWEILAQAGVRQMDLPAGTELNARYNRAGAIWEFATTVIHSEGRDLTLAHAKNIRFVNRRRFRRVKVDRPAIVAPYTFLTVGPHQAPVFHQARLVDFGAAGIVLEVDDLPALADKARVLVVMEPRPGRSISTIGIVLRREEITSRRTMLIIELTDLSEADVSELVSETNLAAQHDQTPPNVPPGQAGPAKATHPAWRE